LVEANILTPDQLETVLSQQRNDSRKKLGQLLVESGLVTETRITQILSQQLSVPWVSLYHIDFSHELLALVRREIADQFGLIPIYVRAVRGQGDTLYVAMEDPMNEDALRECASCAHLPTRAMIAAPSEIRRAIRIYYGASDSFRAARAAASSLPAAPARAEETTKVEPALARVPPPASPAETAAVAPVHASAVAAAPAPAPAISAQPPSDDTPTLEVREVDVSKAARRRKQVLALLDGTTLRLPSARGKAEPDGDTHAGQMIATLRAIARGEQTPDALGPDFRMEKVMAVLLDLLMRKHLVLERELIDALKK
jgi:type IV pilus assembly protein PilB